ncbi:MAG: hypothetical protein COX07_05625 [Bacteroidetes bacterium CG23_combo_of_CG06-09_8_20_14_all_32_9]|nr:MAG: hypothetical protein COX07_05625 [Bacteroidetes bacterium CG23_combo_of_CG06-09_8_20_14_all_32_9]
MKILNFLICVSFTALCACSSNNDNSINTDLINNPLTASGKNADTSLLPKFKWAEQNHDFGVIIQGEKVSYTYTYTNIGKSNLIISSVHTSCGCTVPKYDTEPIMPGKNGKIEIIFDSSNRNGIQNKTLTVLANTQPNKIELHFTAEIVEPEKK